MQVDQEAHRQTKDSSSKEIEEVVAKLGGKSTRLQQMGLLTALALSLHNFPEGLATFIAALSDPSLGKYRAMSSQNSIGFECILLIFPLVHRLYLHFEEEHVHRGQILKRQLHVLKYYCVCMCVHALE